MANINFGKLLPGTVEIPNSQDVNQFKNIVQARWTGNQWRLKGNMNISDGPAKGTWSSESAYSLQREGDMYNSSSNTGLKVYSNSGQGHESIYENYGDGRWMPASVWNGLGFETMHVREGGNSNHDLYIKRYAVIFAHRSTNSYRQYGWNTGYTDRPIGTDYRFDKIHSSMDSTLEIRRWGKDWLFQGLLIQFANNGGTNSTQSHVIVYNLKIGHKYSTIGGQYRYLPAGIRGYSQRDPSHGNVTSNGGLMNFTNPLA